jgi:hypothetical protein
MLSMKRKINRESFVSPSNIIEGGESEPAYLRSVK